MQARTSQVTYLREEGYQNHWNRADTVRFRRGKYETINFLNATGQE